MDNPRQSRASRYATATGLRRSPVLATEALSVFGRLYDLRDRAFLAAWFVPSLEAAASPSAGLLFSLWFGVYADCQIRGSDFDV